MNILPKKRWHVKNKDNAARVEADEARDRKKKNDEKIRSLIATQEARVDYLRKRARGDGSGSKCIITSQDTLRLFADVEENRNLITSNKEYEEELKQEKEAHEKKLGILKYFGETEDGMANVRPWWLEVPNRSSRVTKPKETLPELLEADAIRKQRADPLLQMKLVEEKFEQIREAKRVAELKERAAVAQVMSSCSSLFPDDIKTVGTKRYRNDGEEEEKGDEKAMDEREAKRRRLERLRAERLSRERCERERTAVVLCKSMGLSSAVNAAAASIEAASTVTDERRLPFNSAFNPELSNLAAERRNAHRNDQHRRRYSYK